MPQHSPFKIEIPAKDILSYLFPENKESSDQPIWIDAAEPDRSLSPKQLLQWSKRLGVGLQKLGMHEGDVVMTFATNHIFVPVAYLGVSASGCIFSGCNPAYSVSEIVYQVENTGAKVILVDPALLGSALPAIDKARFPRDKVFLFNDVECQTTQGIRDWRSMIGSPDEAKHWTWRAINGDACATTTAVINYSSGTTGLPKGVMISHQNVIANIEQSIYMRDLEQDYTPKTKPTERWLGFLPLYHAYGQLWSIGAACKLLTPCFFMRTFSFSSFLCHIQTHRITHIQTAPPVLVMLAKRPETVSYDISSLVNILCGAAPLSAELQNEVSTKCNVQVVQTWGMTELTCSMLHVPGGLDDRSGSVGHIDPNASVKLISDDGREVGVGERGEVLVKGPNVCLGYWRNAQATRELFDDDGYMRTGDVAVRNERGWYWIVDRKKELIKVKGFQVAPAELEALLLEHPDVADAAVCALQLDHEELPRGYLVLQENVKGRMTEEDIHTWLNQRVAKHKRLLGGIQFINEVPKSPSGKIQRKVLKEWAAKDAHDFVRTRARAKL